MSSGHEVALLRAAVARAIGEHTRTFKEAHRKGRRKGGSVCPISAARVKRGTVRAMVAEKNPAHGSQVAVVYRNAVLNGVTVEVGSDTLINLVASVLPDHPASAALLKLRPDTIIVGPDVETQLEDLGENVIFCREPGLGSLSLLIRMADSVVVVRCRRVVIEAIIESWVESVVESIEAGHPVSQDVA